MPSPVHLIDPKFSEDDVTIMLVNVWQVFPQNVCTGIAVERHRR
jgi:hypothetical protein